MYDHATKSYWSTMQGEPVVGPLVDKGIKLTPRHVVTTTWGEWKRRHPDTTVLSMVTGHNRDYGEGVAYGKYFATQDLMFSVAHRDDRLQNKDEVFAMRNDDEKLAIAADYLAENPVYQDSLGEQAIVILTDESGANRAYDAGNEKFSSFDGDVTVTDSQNQPWTVSEAALTDPTGRQLKRLPAHRAFWFGWLNQYPETRLVK